MPSAGVEKRYVRIAELQKNINVYAGAQLFWKRRVYSAHFLKFQVSESQVSHFSFRVHLFTLQNKLLIEDTLAILFCASIRLRHWGEVIFGNRVPLRSECSV